MTVSEYDHLRPPEAPRRRRRRGPEGAGKSLRRFASNLLRQDTERRDDGSREMRMVDDVEFSSYYGRPIVKAPPWGHEISTYLFLGGLAGGSALLSLGAELTGRTKLRRNTRLTALSAVGLGTVALIADLGRPERFLNMMRTIKVTSPMSIGTWILTPFATFTGVATVSEIDKMTGEKLPLGPLRPVLHALEAPAGVGAAIFGAPLAAYTGVLLGNTANPVWNGGRNGLSFVFAASATMAAGGTAMATTSVEEAGPARTMALIGVGADIAAVRAMKAGMHPVEVEPLETGHAGKLLKWAEYLTIGGGIGALFGGKNRTLAALSGTALAAASALTRFGVLDAGLASTKDPKYVIEPQKARLAARRAKGITDDSITTGPSTA